MNLVTLPLRLAYPGASTVTDATGEIVAECPTEEAAQALIVVVNMLQTIAEGETEEPTHDAAFALSLLGSKVLP